MSDLIKWYRNAERGAAYHAPAVGWVASALTVCGRSLPRPSHSTYTVSSGTAHDTCKVCYRIVVKPHITV